MDKVKEMEKKCNLTGLTSKDVKERIKNNQVNGDCSVKTKSVCQIICGNVFTLFNGLNVFLAFCVFAVHSYKNAMFMGVVIWNILIGVIQEIRSKVVIDRLSLLSAPAVVVVRDGCETVVRLEEVVLDDVLLLKNGNQIPSDAIILEGECQVNESLLTGESDPVYKKKGDEVLSGSFIISGYVYAKVIHVGHDNYVNRIAAKAKYLKKPSSEILNSIKKIIKLVTISLIPVAALLYMNQLRMGKSMAEAVVSTVAAVIGMIPSGLVLLISVVLAVSVVKLGRQKILVQELFCIENLARVDVLCLDKTGTITEGVMSVQKIEVFDKTMTHDNILSLLKAYTDALDDNNPTFEAVKNYVQDAGVLKLRLLEKEGFSSEKKRSSVTFEDGIYCLGAAEFVDAEISENIQKEIEKYSSNGMRVLVFAKNRCVKAIIVISDTIRKDAKETLTYFRNQGVALKIISGDNPVTVSNIAKRAGLTDYDNYIDATLLKTEEDVKEATLKYSVFGRVTPNQKLVIVKTLKEAGHTVAMTGDGVNDVMALKEADCSIAMESGSDAARNVSQIVLMDSDFAHMPDIVAEGRKTINNIQRSAALYLYKTIYSTLLAVIFIFLPIDFPFEPIQLTLIGSLSIGIPSFILAMEPNVNRVKGSFLGNVLRMAIPGGLLAVVTILAAEILGVISIAEADKLHTMAFYGLAIAAAIHLYKVCIPFNNIRRIMYISLVSAFVFVSIFVKDFFCMVPIRFYHGIGLAIIAVSSMILYAVIRIFVEKAMGTTPNIYKVCIAYCNGKRVVLVIDDVERKDYYDVTVQMKGLKVLKADSVVFIQKSLGADIRAEANDVIEAEEIMCVAAYCHRKIMKSKRDENILVESMSCNNVSDLDSVADNPVCHIKAGADKIMEYVEGDNMEYRPRLMKKIRITF